MSIVLQVTLIVFCLMLLFLIMRQIANARVIFSDFNYWVLFLILLVILAIFPDLSAMIANILHIQTQIVAVFLIVFFLLMLLVLSLSFRISVLNRRFIQLTQKLALLEYETEEKIKQFEEKEIKKHKTKEERV